MRYTRMIHDFEWWNPNNIRKEVEMNTIAVVHAWHARSMANKKFWIIQMLINNWRKRCFFVLIGIPASVICASRIRRSPKHATTTTIPARGSLNYVRMWACNSLYSSNPEKNNNMNNPGNHENSPPLTWNGLSASREGRPCKSKYLKNAPYCQRWNEGRHSH